MDLIIFTSLLLILVRINAIEGQRVVPEETFKEALSKNAEPAVMVYHRKLTWLMFLPRYNYVQYYKGFKLSHRTFQPIQLSDHIDLIPVESP